MTALLNRLFGPSIHLMILDMILDNPDEYMNVREIARRIDKNPGSVSRVMGRLVDEGYVEQIQVGMNMYAYHLDRNNELVSLLIDFKEKVSNLEGQGNPDVR